jgi:hypothetical protein
MLQGGDETTWAQIGYVSKNFGQRVRLFWQWTKCYPLCADNYCPVAPCVHDGLYQTPVEGVYHLFAAQRTNSTGLYRIHLTWDSQDAPDNGSGVPSHTSFDPVNQSQWIQPFRTTYSEEIHWCGTDFAGTPSSKTNFTDITQSLVGGTWVAHSLSGTGWESFTDIEGIGHMTDDSSYPPAHFQVWTDRGTPDLTC